MKQALVKKITSILTGQKDNKEKSYYNQELLEKIRQFVGNAKLDDALNLLIQIDKSETIELKGRLSAVKRKKQQGIIKYEDESIEVNKISAFIISLVDDLEKDLKLPEPKEIKEQILKQYKARLNSKLIFELPINISCTSTKFGTTENTISIFEVNKNLTIRSENIASEIKRILKEYGRLLIIGEPGSGKSISLLKTAIVILEDKKEDKIPLLLNLATWQYKNSETEEPKDDKKNNEKEEPTDNKKQRFENWYEDSLKNSYRLLGKDIQYLIKDKNIIPFFDGIDEVSEIGRTDLLQCMRSYFGTEKNLQFVISSRKVEYGKTPADAPIFAEVELNPLTIEQIREALNENNKIYRSSNQLINAINKNKYLQSVVTTPFYLELASKLSEEKDDNLNIKSTEKEKVKEELVEKFINNRDINQREKTYVHFLANKMNEQGFNTFNLNNIQPFWCKSINTFRFLRALMWVILSGIIVGAVSMFIVTENSNKYFVIGLLSFILILLGNWNYKIVLTETKSWAFDTFKNNFTKDWKTGIILILIGSLIASLLFGIIFSIENFSGYLSNTRFIFFVLLIYFIFLFFFGKGEEEMRIINLSNPYQQYLNNGLFAFFKFIPALLASFYFTHSVLLKPTSPFNPDEYIGIGITPKKENNFIIIKKITEGGPSEKSKKLRINDTILNVSQSDGTSFSVTGHEVNEVISQIKGKQGTEVKITVKHIDGTIETIPIIRDVVYKSKFTNDIILFLFCLIILYPIYVSCSIEHIATKLVLWKDGKMPFRVVKFMDRMSELYILENNRINKKNTNSTIKKLRGVQWRFRHKILQDYLANEGLGVLIPEDFSIYYTLGLRSFNKSNFLEAIEHLEKADKIKNVSVPKLYDYLFLSNINIGNIEKAKKYYKKSNRLPILYQGLNYLQEADYDNAITKFDEVIRLDLKLFEAYSYKGDAYLKKGDKLQAIKCYEKAVEIQPDQYGIYPLIGNLYLEIGESSQAIATLQEAIRIKPDSGELYFALGKIYLQINNPENAISYFNKAISIYGEDHETLINLSQSYFELSEFDKAIECLEKALELQPDNYQIHNLIGMVYFEQKKFKKAIEFYENYIKINEENINTYINLSMCYFQVEKYKESIETLEQVIKIQPQNYDIYSLIWISYYKIGNYNKAIESLQKALDNNPDELELKHSIGWIHLINHNLEEAEKCFKEVWQSLKIKNAPMNLGHIFLLKGNKPQACMWYKISLLLWDKQEDFWDGMESDYIDLKMDEYDISRELYNEILKELKNEEV